MKEAPRDRVAAPVKTSATKPAKSTRKKTVDTEGEDIPEDWPVVRGDLVLVKWCSSTESSNNMEEEYTMGTVCAYPICYHHLSTNLSEFLPRDESVGMLT